MNEKHLRNIVLRMYWDGEEAPSVEVPLGDFFCNRFAAFCRGVSRYVAPNREKGLGGIGSDASVSQSDASVQSGGRRCRIFPHISASCVRARLLLGDAAAQRHSICGGAGTRLCADG